MLRAPQRADHPALRVRLQSLDLNYSALLRKLHEALQAAQEEEEEGAVSTPENPRASRKQAGRQAGRQAGGHLHPSAPSPLC